jgi:succinate-semialdehyde dehydrogenase/glutarate-semialdehyde dehydrogenase
MAIASVNPATGQLLRRFEPLSDSETEAKLRRAADTFPRFRKLSFAERAVMMRKTLPSAIAEAAKCATACRYYAENAERFLADEVVETGAGRRYIR